MRLILISDDYEVYRTCCNILQLAQLGDVEIIVNPPQPFPAGDICIWDYQDSTPPDVFTAFNGTRVLIVSRKELSAFPSGLAEGINVVLRPATEATLSAFITSIDRHPARSRLAALSSDRDALLQLLFQANLKLQEYDHARTNFLARAAHDCRAPLTALAGYCSLLLKNQVGALTEEQHDILARMQSSINRLSRLSSEMFQLNIDSRMAAEPQIDVHPIEPSVQEALRQIAPLAAEKHISIDIDIHPHVASISFDAFRIEQVLINLLENSCKFTPQSGNITIRGYEYFWDRRRSMGPFAPVDDRRQSQIRRPNSYRLDISDTGPGVPPEHKNSIFEEYTSYRGSEDRSCGGLGLAICRMIITHHKGIIWADDSDYGAVFSFVLPFKRATQASMTRVARSSA